MNRKQAITYLNDFVRTSERLAMENQWNMGNELCKAIKLLLKDEKQPRENKRGG